MIFVLWSLCTKPLDLQTKGLEVWGTEYWLLQDL